MRLERIISGLGRVTIGKDGRHHRGRSVEEELFKLVLSV